MGKTGGGRLSRHRIIGAKSRRLTMGGQRPLQRSVGRPTRRGPFSCRKATDLEGRIRRKTTGRLPARGRGQPEVLVCSRLLRRATRRFIGCSSGLGRAEQRSGQRLVFTAAYTLGKDGRRSNVPSKGRGPSR